MLYASVVVQLEPSSAKRLRHCGCNVMCRYRCFVFHVRMRSHSWLICIDVMKYPTCASQVAALVRFVMAIGAGPFVDELCNFHASNVNPNDLSMSHSVFEEASCFAYVACHSTALLGPCFACLHSVLKPKSLSSLCRGTRGLLCSCSTLRVNLAACV